MKESLSQPSVPIIGAWKLISFEIQKADGGIIYPFGENAQGALIYAESGRFSGQVMRPGRLSSHLEIRCEEQPRKSKPIIKVSYQSISDRPRGIPPQDNTLYWQIGPEDNPS